MTEFRPTPRESGEPPFPGAVLVGYRRYRIGWWTPLQAAAAGARGYTSHQERAILVLREGVDLLEVAEVLLHELLHCLLIPAGCARSETYDPDNSEERLVTVLGHGLTDLLTRNPALRAWLAWAWGREP